MVCVSCVWAGVDSAWKQEKLKVIKMLEKRHRTHLSSALSGDRPGRFVGQVLIYQYHYICLPIR
jgi:hypothetical protein